MQSDTLEFFLKKTKELEQKYEWLQTTKFYQKVSNLFLEDNNFLRAAKVKEKIGFCFHKAAFQVKTTHQ